MPIRPLPPPQPVMSSAEWTPLTKTWSKDLAAPASDPSAMLVQGLYREILTTSFAREFFNGADTERRSERVEQLVQSLDTTGYIDACLDQFLQHDGPERQVQVLLIAAACLNAFIQGGWTGPKLNFELSDIIHESVADKDGDIHQASLLGLSVDSEDVYSLTPRTALLAISLAILDKNSHRLSSLQTIGWWRYRALYIQQQLLDNPSGTLLDKITAALDALPPFCRGDSDLHARFMIESGLVHSYYGQDAKAASLFEKATEVSNFKWSLTGALGRRTKFQTFDVAQLVVVAESSSNETASAGSEASAKPESLALNDEVLLEKIAFTQDNDGIQNQGKLKTIDQCILLAHCLNIKNINPDHGLTKQEMAPYVMRVLDNPNNWMVHTMALLLRTRLESDKSRTVERSVLQLQALVDQFPLEESAPGERLDYFFSISLPSKWDMEKELARAFMSLGVVRSALDIFERLEMWEDAVSCHQLLGKDKQAESLVRRLLEEHPTSPKYHCILGDITKDHTLYEKAWEISGQRFARAMRSLGAHWFRAHEWHSSIECYQKALSINPLFENSWFVLGCAAMRTEDWQLGAEAFTRVVTLDNNNGEAWTNLSSIYIRQKNKRGAWRALREALRHQYENYKVWQNYMYTSCDLKEFKETIRAMERIFDIQMERSKDESIVDLEVLDILVDAVVVNETDADGNAALLLAPKIAGLLEHITSKITNNPDIFTTSARFYFSVARYRRSLDCHLKAYRVLQHQPSLTTDEAIFKRAATAALELVDAYIALGPKKEVARMGEMSSAPTDEAQEPADAGQSDEGEVVCKDWAYQAKMTLRTLIGRTKDSFEGHELHDALKEKLAEINEAIRSGQI
ncbi:uncharacterized protein BJ171DRAFT_557816 [Polychytrium aggregatum]|uniref:uncharacterized protein n=1 Tax=Polychytrium aggregatum TaxID=110093 RepID=UPI0022FEB591|nr:uncharacterized protein BJ171DRAFT_557816 [Polychytrium aggregatum]KAI9208102.1 hypothetical protein BJ171DRAFT_557816 [Polychytrium aggregatum]